MRSIRGRLLALLLTGLMLVLAGSGAAVYFTALRGLVHQFDAGLLSRAHVLASLVKLEPEGLVLETSDAPAATIAETYFEIHVRSGRMLKRSANLEGAALPDREPVDEEFVIEDLRLPSDIDGRAIWLVFRPRVDPDDWQGRDITKADPEELIVAAALDRGSIDRAMAALLGALMVVGGIVAVTVVVLVLAGVRWGLAPLDRLSRQIGGISGETISRRLSDPAAPRELAPIYRELNHLLDRVEKTIERERSFVDAAAHELRTPLAELRATAEVAIRWPDAAQATAAFREMLAIGQDMEKLVESLLHISRGQAGDFARERPVARVSDLVHQCVQQERSVIDGKQLKLALDIPDNASIPASSEAVEIIIRNLIGNAVHYTPPGGRVSIRTAGENGTMSLIVENGPVELTEQDLPRLFDPFWRMDTARSDRQHVGLGLTVVHRIAGALGLRVDASLAGDSLQIRVGPNLPVTS